MGPKEEKYGHNKGCTEGLRTRNFIQFYSHISILLVKTKQNNVEKDII